VTVVHTLSPRREGFKKVNGIIRRPTVCEKWLFRTKAESFSRGETAGAAAPAGLHRGTTRDISTFHQQN
jgi:hypothetical protein